MSRAGLCECDCECGSESLSDSDSEGEGDGRCAWECGWACGIGIWICIDGTVVSEGEEGEEHGGKGEPVCCE